MYRNPDNRPLKRRRKKTFRSWCEDRVRAEHIESMSWGSFVPELEGEPAVEAAIKGVIFILFLSVHNMSV